jgi:SAM-dependent methyltransferase
MNSPIRQNRAAYDQIAPRFAERNAEILPYIIDASARLLERLKAAGDVRLPILDLGCGAGRDTDWLESQGACLVGGDLSWGMLAEARGRVRAPLCQLDMCWLPFRAEAFPAVWCQAALLHLPKDLAPGALLEMRRVLQPGGLLHISVQKGDSEGFETRPYEPVERYYAHYQPAELTGLVQTAGFALLNVDEALARRPWIWILAQKG